MVDLPQLKPREPSTANRVTPHNGLSRGMREVEPDCTIETLRMQ